jgi:hypothetical protein
VVVFPFRWKNVVDHKSGNGSRQGRILWTPIGPNARRGSVENPDGSITFIFGWADSSIVHIRRHVARLSAHLFECPHCLRHFFEDRFADGSIVLTQCLNDASRTDDGIPFADGSTTRSVDPSGVFARPHGTAVMFDDDIDPRKDAQESAPDWAKERRRFVRSPTEAELDPSSYFFLEGASFESLIFPGGGDPSFVHRDVGVDLQAVKVEKMWQVHSVKPGSNKWSKLLGEYDTEPKNTWRDKSEGGPGYFTPEGHKVDPTAYLGVVRRGDPNVYTIHFPSLEMHVFKAWFELAQNPTSPFFSSRWNWRQVDVGDDRGTHKWAFTRLGSYNDGSPEAPTPAEYRAARAISRGEATSMPMEAFPKAQTNAARAPASTTINGKPSKPKDDLDVEGMRPFAPIDDEIPF